MSHKLRQSLEPWIVARRKHRLSHAHVHMARELGMNPKTLGKIDNHKQEAWKLPLPDFIEELYFKRFGRERPEKVITIEERLRLEEERRAARQEAKRLRRVQRESEEPLTETSSTSTSSSGLDEARTEVGDST